MKANVAISTREPGPPGEGAMWVTARPRPPHGRIRAGGTGAAQGPNGPKPAAAGGGDRGSATVELAVALPAVVVVLAAALWGVSAASAQVACVDAARAGARAAARGEPPEAVRAAVLAAAPPRTQVSIGAGRTMTKVEVRAIVRSPVPGAFPDLTLRAHVVAATEPMGARRP